MGAAVKRWISGLLCTLLALNAAATSWLSPVPIAGQRALREKVTDSDFFEVPVSKFEAAEESLSAAVYVSLDSRQASYYGHPEFQCLAPRTLYLVRAAFSNGGTGAFSIFWQGTGLVVSHMSLGSPGMTERSALVVCLANAPAAVYSAIGGAL
jgi:hypothetical protein